MYERFHCAGIGMSRDKTDADSFWRFSLMVYSRPGVADALLGLQDRGGHNVNLVLFGLWLAMCRAARLDPAGLARARAAIAGLDETVVAPLRRLRRALKADPDADFQALRRRVLALEIGAERSVQARLAASAPTPRGPGAADRVAIVEANLRLILGDDFDLPAGAVLRALAGEATA
jgi:uncharacterized protein (TIGR02444 family)